MRLDFNLYIDRYRRYLYQQLNRRFLTEVLPYLPRLLLIQDLIRV